MLNYVNYSEIHDNVINKAGKCVFAYNANYNKIFDNHFETVKSVFTLPRPLKVQTCSIPPFINNESQVKYVSTCFDWGEGGHGN